MIIAECGLNYHNLIGAMVMILKSKEAGVDACKFQLYDDSVIGLNPFKSELKEMMLSKDDATELFNFGRQYLQMDVFFTPMFLEAVDWCEEIGVKQYKIRHADRYNTPLIEKVLDTGKPIIVSLDRKFLVDPDLLIQNFERFKFLLCVPKYPATVEDYKINRDEFIPNGILSGISDHTPGMELAKKVRAYGRDLIIEKHVKPEDDCIEKDWSITFKELEELCQI